MTMFSSILNIKALLKSLLAGNALPGSKEIGILQPVSSSPTGDAKHTLSRLLRFRSIGESGRVLIMALLIRHQFIFTQRTMAALMLLPNITRQNYCQVSTRR